MSPERKILIMIMIPVVATLGFIVLVVIPQQTELALLENQIDEQRILIEIRKEKLEVQSAASPEFEHLQEVQSQIANSFLTENDELKFFTALEDIAVASGVRQTIDFQPQTAAGTPQALAIQLTTVGSFANLLRYLKNLEGNDPLLSITTLSMNPAGGGGDVQLSLQAMVLWKPHD